MTLSKDIVKFNSHTTARDKIFRTIQYGSRLLLWQMTHGSSEVKGEVIDRLRKLEGAVGLSRKLFRLGNVLDFVHKTIDAASSPPSVINILTVISHSFKGLWLAMDHLLWLAKVGIVKIQIAYWTRWSLRAWLVALVSAVTLDLIKMNNTHNKVSRHHKENGDKKPYSETLQVEVRTVQMTLWRDACDLCIPLGGLQYISPGIAAFSGTISSMIGFVQEWEKHISPYKPVVS